MHARPKSSQNTHKTHTHTQHRDTQTRTTHTHTHARARTHTRAHTHTRTRAHTHTHKGMPRTNTHTRARARTHAHTKTTNLSSCAALVYTIVCTSSPQARAHERPLLVPPASAPGRMRHWLLADRIIYVRCARPTRMPLTRKLARGGGSARSPPLHSPASACPSLALRLVLEDRLCRSQGNEMSLVSLRMGWLLGVDAFPGGDAAERGRAQMQDGRVGAVASALGTGPGGPVSLAHMFEVGAGAALATVTGDTTRVGATAAAPTSTTVS